MKCKHCGCELKSPTLFCLFCGNANALGCGVYFSEKLYLVFVGDRVEVLTFKVYEEEESIRNLFEVVAERIHERRVDKVIVSGNNKEFVARMIQRCALSPVDISITDDMEFDEFVKKLEEYFKKSSKIERVSANPEDKIGGSHTTIIGGRAGYELVLKLASSPFVKKVVPGVIENKGTSQGGVRLKITRCDDRGNLRALLIHGAAVQQIYVITTASNKEKGELVMKELSALF